MFKTNFTNLLIILIIISCNEDKNQINPYNLYKTESVDVKWRKISNKQITKYFKSEDSLHIEGNLHFIISSLTRLNPKYIILQNINPNQYYSIEVLAKNQTRDYQKLNTILKGLKLKMNRVSKKVEGHKIVLKKENIPKTLPNNTSMIFSGYNLPWLVEELNYLFALDLVMDKELSFSHREFNINLDTLGGGEMIISELRKKGFIINKSVVDVPNITIKPINVSEK